MSIVVDSGSGVRMRSQPWPLCGASIAASGSSIEVGFPFVPMARRGRRKKLPGQCPISVVGCRLTEVSLCYSEHAEALAVCGGLEIIAPV